MRSQRTGRMAGILFFALLVFLHPAQDPPRAQTGCSIQYADDKPINKPFPYYPGTNAERRVVDLLFEPLVRMAPSVSDTSLMLDCRNARSEQKGRVWAFPLLPTSWHSGRPVTTDQIVRTFRELQRLQQRGRINWLLDIPYFQQLVDMSGDQQTLRVTYAEPVEIEQAVAYLRNFYVIPWEDLPRLTSSYDGHLDDWIHDSGELDEGLIGNGRWMASPNLGMITAAREIWLTAFPGFPGGPSRINQVKSWFLPLPSDRVERFLDGSVNLVLDLPPTLLPRAMRVPGCQEFPHENNCFTFIQISTRNPALKDTRVREALTYAIDRQALLISQYAGRGSVIDAPFPPGTICFNEDIVPRGFDPGRSQELLREAGFTGSPSEGWRKGGQTLDNLDFFLEQTMLGQEVQEIVVRTIDYWAGIGVHVELRTEEEDIVKRARSEGNYDFLLVNLASGNNWDLRWILSHDISRENPAGGGGEVPFPENRYIYCGEDVEKLLAQYHQIAGNDLKMSDVGSKLHAAIYRSCDHVYLWALQRGGVFNSSSLIFQKSGPSLFENPAMWGCPRR